MSPATLVTTATAATAGTAGTAGPAPSRRAVRCRCRAVTVDMGPRRSRRPVLDRVDLDLAEGEFVSILGRSGTGKTTLLRVLGGLLRPEPGSDVTCDGCPVDGPPDGVVFVFQNYAASLLPWRTVAGNVALGLEGRMPAAEVRARVGEALAAVGLADRAGDHPAQMSGGMQQRVQLARALAMRPRGLLLDEPFGSLDAMTKAALQDELQGVHRRTGATVAFVTHDIDEAVYLSDRVVVLAGSPGTVAADIPVDLPRPRGQIATREDPEFLRLRRLVHAAIAGDAG